MKKIAIISGILVTLYVGYHLGFEAGRSEIRRCGMESKCRDFFGKVLECQPRPLWGAPWPTQTCAMGGAAINLPDGSIIKRVEWFEPGHTSGVYRCTSEEP